MALATSTEPEGRCCLHFSRCCLTFNMGSEWLGMVCGMEVLLMRIVIVVCI